MITLQNCFSILEKISGNHFFFRESGSLLGEESLNNRFVHVDGKTTCYIIDKTDKKYKFEDKPNLNNPQFVFAYKMAIMFGDLEITKDHDLKNLYLGRGKEIKKKTNKQTHIETILERLLPITPDSLSERLKNISLLSFEIDNYIKCNFNKVKNLSDIPGDNLSTLKRNVKNTKQPILQKKSDDIKRIIRENEYQCSILNIPDIDAFSNGFDLLSVMIFESLFQAMETMNPEITERFKQKNDNTDRPSIIEKKEEIKKFIVEKTKGYQSKTSPSTIKLDKFYIYDKNGYAKRIIKPTVFENNINVNIDYSIFKDLPFESYFCGIAVKFIPSIDISRFTELSFEFTFIDEGIDQVDLELKTPEIYGRRIEYKREIIPNVINESIVKFDITDMPLEIKTNLEEICFASYPAYFADLNNKKGNYKIGNQIFFK